MRRDPFLMINGNLIHHRYSRKCLASHHLKTTGLLDQFRRVVRLLRDRHHRDQSIRQTNHPDYRDRVELNRDTQIGFLLLPCDLRLCEVVFSQTFSDVCIVIDHSDLQLPVEFVSKRHARQLHSQKTYTPWTLLFQPSAARQVASTSPQQLTVSTD